MANFYLDNSDLKHHLNHPLMKRLVALKERNYTDAEKYDYAPIDFGFPKKEMPLVVHGTYIATKLALNM